MNRPQATRRKLLGALAGAPFGAGTAANLFDASPNPTTARVAISGTDARDASRINWLRASAGAVLRSVADALEDRNSVMDFIPIASRIAIRKRTSNTDVSMHINAAIAALAEAGGGELLVPAGTYYLTSPVQMKIGVDLVGVGFASQLRFIKCDGITWDFTTGFGMSRVQNLYVAGNDGDGDDHAAFYQPGTSDSRNQLLGVKLIDVLATGFKRGASFRNVHNLYIVRPWFENVARGIELIGSCLNVNIDTPNLVRAAGAGTWNDNAQDVGIYTDYFEFKRHGGLIRPEHVVIKAPRIYGFPTGVNFEAVVFATVTDFDIQSTAFGITWSSASSGLHFHGGYVEVAGSRVQAGAWGKNSSVSIASRNTFKNVCFIATENSTFGGIPPQGATGILLGSSDSVGNQDNVSIEDCVFEGFKRYDIAIYRSGNISIRNVDCRSTAVADSILTMQIPAGQPVRIDQFKLQKGLRFDSADWHDGILQLGCGIINGSVSFDGRDPWVPIAYSADRFSVSKRGAWTIPTNAGSEYADSLIRYRLRGQSVHVAVNIPSSVLAGSGGDGNELRIDLPASLSARYHTVGLAHAMDEVGAISCRCEIAPGAHVIRLKRNDAAAWPSERQNLALYASIEFERILLE